MQRSVALKIVVANRLVSTFTLLYTIFLNQKVILTKDFTKTMIQFSLTESLRGKSNILGLRPPEKIPLLVDTTVIFFFSQNSDEKDFSIQVLQTEFSSQRPEGNTAFVLINQHGHRDIKQ